MIAHDQPLDLGQALPAGAHHYRAFIGPPEKYDQVAAMQFNLLTFLGLKEEHYFLDIGCGSLRAGKLFIPYLLPGRYHGIEPEQWLVEEGIEREIGRDQITLKRPAFSHDANFTLSTFNRTFDYLIAQSIFSHTSQAQIRRCLSEAQKVMTPGAIFAATYIAGEENYAGEEWVYPGCVKYRLERMKSLAGEQGLVCAPLAWTHPNGQTWLCFMHADKEPLLRALCAQKEPLYLEKQLQEYKKRLTRLEGHTYVKVGMGLKRLVRKMKVWKR